jgi:uncharacterized membrane protein
LPSLPKIIFAICAIAAYIALMYVSARAPDAAARTVVLTVLAWQGFAAWLLWQNGKRAWACALLLPAALLYVYYDDLKHFEWLCLAPNVLVNASLLFFFARTLAPGKQALITMLATKVHGSLPPPIERYTRHLTYVWSGFFAISILISVGLYFFVSFAAWSLFSNVYALPMMLGLFAVEYLYRRLRFPWFEHVSIAAGMKAFASLTQPTAQPQTQPRTQPAAQSAKTTEPIEATAPGQKSP